MPTPTAAPPAERPRGARHRGTIVHTALFDTLGDGQPGGEFLEASSVLHGPHPAFDDDFPFCELAAELTPHGTGDPGLRSRPGRAPVRRAGDVAGDVHRLLAALLLLALAAPAAAQAEPAPSLGRSFAPRPIPPAPYEASTTPAGNATIRAADGTDLYVEWWLPERREGGPPVPAKLPVILMLSPYAAGAGDPRERDTLQTVVPQGYAYGSFHVRGTGLSGGCQEQFSDNETDDAARAIEFFGTAPFSDGNVGTTGLSYPGITQVAAAGKGDPEKVRYLKAIVAGGVATSQYDYNFFDGVPFAGQALAHMASYNGLNSLPSPGTRTYPAERASCLPEITLGSADTSGSMTPFWQEREMRSGAKRTTAAALVYHGHRDEIDREIALAGYFDRLPPTTPRHLVLGTWAHAYPDDVRGQTPWDREDWEAMKLAWFDAHLKGEDGATAGWPVAQVQDASGQWRAEPDWPRAGGPDLQLALGAGGRLGGDAPTGASGFVEGASTEGPLGKQARGSGEGRLVFSTGPLAGPLHVTGQPVLDLWVTLDRPDAHVAARLEALDAGGRVIPRSETMGFRSLQHLEPLVEGRFAQTEAKLAPVLTPVRVPLRFDPASFEVPEGGSLRLVLSGSLAPNALTPSQPSGLATRVTVLHDCAHPSVLRFQGLPERPDLLDVHEVDEPLPLLGGPVPATTRDGGGVASGPVCGRAPFDGTSLLGG